ncbi:hypothetical protein QL285_006771 [Trifolium repens]|nr:hypothetical protein QL285_006771 [Trifolium repens]
MRTKCRFIAPTTEKSWQSLLLGRLHSPLRGLWSIAGGSINTLLHWKVRYSILYSLSLSVLVHSTDLSIGAPAGTTPPFGVDFCSTHQDSSSSEGFAGPEPF